MINVKVLGSGCNNCATTAQRIQTVADENGITIHLEKVEDMEKIMAYGILSTPGVVIDEKIAHTGSVPDKKAILSWFKSSCCPQDDKCC